jgi:hypothetical protein
VTTIETATQTQDVRVGEDEAQWSYMAEIAFLGHASNRMQRFRAPNGTEAWGAAQQIAQEQGGALARLWTEVAA